MGVPRIHFEGWFQSDVSTGNNYRENYLISKYREDDIYPSWNPNGTGEFWFYKCVVTSVVYADGSTATTQDEDAIIGKPIVNNPAMVPAKVVDLDSPQHDVSSTLFGMRFGIDWKPNERKNKNAFIGEWEPSILSRDLWGRLINDTTADRFTQTIASQGTSRLHNIEWGKIKHSKALQQLQKGYESTEVLSVSVSVFNFTRPYQEDRFLYGVVVGTIGVGSMDEPLNFVGDRVMNFLANPPATTIPGETVNPCIDAKNDKWLYTAYFSINDIKKRHYVTVDFSNSIKLDFGGNICDFGPLYLGILTQTVSSKEQVEIIGAIPYRDKDWYRKTAGVNDFVLTSEQYEVSKDSEFVVVKLNKETDVDGTYPPCSTSNSDQTLAACVYIILKESAIQVRPMDHNVIRLEAEQSLSLRMIVRKFGKPMANKAVKLLDMSPNGPESTNGLEYKNPVTTGEDGIATFNFLAKLSEKPRGKSEMDGEVYAFGYCTDSDCLPENCETGYTNQISFLVWEKTTYDRPIFWDTHVQPIFKQYEILYPTMRNILRLGEYEDVVKPENIRLLKKAMSLDFNHPSYMPVSRDLSPSRRSMILEWLHSDGLYRNWSHVDEVRYQRPEFCFDKVYLDEHFSDKKVKYQVDMAEDSEQTMLESLMGDDKNLRRFQILAVPKPGQDIPEWKKEEDQKICSKKSLKRDLQDAITLEFATIPLYLTSMYSIKASHNQEVRAVIRSVVMQEMLHMAQAANILIAIGGEPIIDDKEHLPTFPGPLPVGILPQLNVTLQKASPKHIHEVFMMVEFPHDEHEIFPEVSKNDLTIGKFYRQIKRCMVKLAKEGRVTFCEGITDTECEAKQMYWPWEQYDTSSNLYRVTNLKTAKKAIKMIVEQGEGAGKQDPTYLDTNKLAHFYKFEELACKQHMTVLHEHEYGFSGGEIEFTSEGVWPMRDNPGKEGIPPGTQLYYSAKRFHRIYRSLLAKFQEMFDGRPEVIDDVVYLMESLQLHTKELMRAEIPTNPGWPKQTCGPIFDYDWDD